MLNSILASFSTIEIAFGTVLSVLCILRMSIKDVMKTSTYGGISENWMATLRQRHYARCGIAFIVAGSALQVLLQFMLEVKMTWFWILILIAVLIPVIVSFVLTKKYIQTKRNGWKKYE